MNKLHLIVQEDLPMEFQNLFKIKADNQKEGRSILLQRVYENEESLIPWLTKTVNQIEKFFHDKLKIAQDL